MRATSSDEHEREHEAGVTRVQEFEELRPLLYAISYRILGSVGAGQSGRT